MDATFLFALLNPAMSLIYAGVFLTLWLYRRESDHLRLLAICYASLALSFVLLVANPPVGATHFRALANFLALCAAVCLSAAFFRRCETRFPASLMLGVAAATYAAFLWYLYADPNVVARIYVINSGAAVIVATTALFTFRRARGQADRVMVVLLLVYAVLSIGRPLVTLPFDQLAPGATIGLSRYWMVFGFTHAIISLLMVFALVTGVVLDVMRELRRTTITDPLSGLMNRRGFEQAVREWMDRGSGSRVPLALIICDLDRFKLINDNFGHRAGDQVITLFAGIVRDVVGEDHVTGRLGGEEFGILLIGSDIGVAEMVAQGVRVGFSATTIPASAIGNDRRLTASFGVAQWQPGEGYEDLLKRADAALYEAKNSGRDAVHVASRDRTPAVIPSAGRAT